MSDSSTTNLWLLLEVAARRRALILGIVLPVTLAAIVIALVLPKYYEAEALLLPPKDTTMPLAGSSRMAEVVSVTQGLNLPVMVTTSDVYARMLQSRSLADVIIGKYDLLSLYEGKNLDEAYLTLMERSTFEVTHEGLLRVAVEDRDPDLAAQMVNTYVDELDRMNREIARQRAENNRGFLQQRLQQVKIELDSARAALEFFQMTHRAVDFTEQTRLAVDQAIQLKIKLAETDIEISLLEGKLGAENVDLLEWRHRRDIIAGELSTLELENSDSSFFSLPIASIPGLRGEYDELLSHVRVSEALYQTLLSHLEQAKIQEKEELPTITVLDRARSPQLRSRPKRSLIVAGAFLISLIFAVGLASFLEYLLRLQQYHPEDYQRASVFIRAFFGWLPGVGKQTRT
ncbi:MAG: GNVR domain-containing protein [bacterium]